MNIESFVEYCNGKTGVTEDFPFDRDTLVMKVGGKMFALTSLAGWENSSPSVNLKCDPARAEELRAEFTDITPGFHMSKVHWNTVAANKSVSDKMLKELIDHSYELVYKSLTRKIRDELIGR